MPLTYLSDFIFFFIFTLEIILLRNYVYHFLSVGYQLLRDKYSQT